jgi:nitrous oxidase accessory protein NosD
MRVKMTLVAAALAGLTMMLLSGPAAADVIKVSPGQSIQSAINKADEGDTVKLAPGTYSESVQIKTDGITLKGSGSDQTVIQPGTSSGDPFCEGNGICVADVSVTDPNSPPTVRNVVSGVHIKDLKVTGFAFTGILFFGTSDQRVNDVLAEDNQGYGMAAFNTSGGQYWDNVTPRNHEAGIYVGDSPHADAVVRDNVSYGNVGNGIFIRDSQHGVVEDNQTFDNCIGILFLDTPAPTTASDWTGSDNSANHNNTACPKSDDGPAVSGLGIVIFAAQQVTLTDNTANGNQPGGDTVASAGIGVVSDPQNNLTATGNTIKHNSAFGNSPVDLLWDQQGDNTFKANKCKTSNPDGLCSGGHEHGNGDHGHKGDHGNQGDNGGRNGKHHNKHHKHHHHKHHKHHKD